MNKQQLEKLVEETWEKILEQMDWTDEIYRSFGNSEQKIEALQEGLWDYLEKQFKKVLEDQKPERVFCICGFDMTEADPEENRKHLMCKPLPQEPSLPRFNPPVSVSKRDLENAKTESLLERMAEMINCFCPCNCKFITEPNRCAKCRIMAEYEAQRGGREGV